MDKYLLANKFLNEGYDDEILEESLTAILPDVVLSMMLGVMGIGVYKGAIAADGDNLAKQIKAKVLSLKDKKTDNLAPMQRLRVKLSNAVEHSNDFLHHAITEVIKSGDSEKVANKLSKKLKLDDEEVRSLETYLTAIVHKIRTTKPLTDA